MDEIEKTEIKPATTFEQQLEILRNRGLVISDNENALNVLRSVNYYRFSAYTLTLKNRSTNEFHENTTFEDVFRLYEFDSKLRHLLVGVLEAIEIAFRTRVAYEFAHSYGPLGYQKSEYFKKEEFHQDILKELQNAIAKNQEIFIEHHKKKYGGEFPIWVAIELLSFGTVSKIYANMLDHDKDRIAKNYYLTSSEYLESWLRTAVYIRNICAHYGRLYNKYLKVTPKLHTRNRGIIESRKLFSAIFVLRELHPTWNDWRSFVINLEVLMEEYQNYINLTILGFPSDWISLLLRLDK